jgi:RNA polymerase sigma-B factor
MVADGLDERFEAYAASRDPRLRDELVVAHQWIAVQVARRFRDRGEPLDDLIQVASLGLVKAVERFDVGHGSSFVSFAMPTVLGEVRRHFRDATWGTRVPRRAKELSLALGKASAALEQQLGRSPRIGELAEHLDVSEDAVLEAFEAQAAYRAAPLVTRAEEGGTAALDPVGEGEAELATAVDRQALRQLLATLPARERHILYLRYFENMSQSEIAAVVGTSQVHVSRLLRASLERLRETVGARPEG